jgi:hypothetical protein
LNLVAGFNFKLFGLYMLRAFVGIIFFAVSAVCNHKCTITSKQEYEVMMKKKCNAIISNFITFL